MRAVDSERIAIKRASGGGVTVAELLVVVVIVAMLSAILFPVLVKAKENARVAECLSNMKQMGAGLHMYLDEYDSHFPSAVPWGSPSYWSLPENGGQKTIQQVLTPYMAGGRDAPEGGDMYSSPGVFGCPSDTGIPASCLAGCDSVMGVPPGQPIWRYTGCSYEYYASNQQDWLSPDGSVVPWTGLSPDVQIGSTTERIGAPLAAIFFVTKKAVLGDIFYWHMGDLIPDGSVAYRNTLFADGHAARVGGVSHLEARLQQLSHWHPYVETCQ